MKRSTPRLMPLCLLLCAAIVGAQTTTRPGSYTPNFQNQDISVVADAVGAATGITFLPDPRARANVSLSLPAGVRPLTAQQFYAMFLSMLGQNGFVAVPAGNNTMKIVPEGNARSMPGNDLPANSNFALDEIVTDVLETKNVNGLQVATTLRSFISQAGQIVPVPGTNTMIITERAGNVARLKRILARVDQSSNSDIQMIPLENAIASEVARLLTSLLTAQPAEAAGGGSVVPRVQSDDRTNSIVVSGDPAQRLRIAALASELDAPVSNGGGTQVFSLHYAVATELATTLNAQITGQAASSGGGTAGAAGAAAAPSVAANADRNVKIIAHEATNKLIITAPSRQMMALSSIIEALDVAPDQVHIEAIVAEISDRQAADLGVNWAVFSTDDNTSVPIMGFNSPVAGAGLGEVAATVVDIESTIASGGLPTGATFGIGRLKDTGVSFAAMLRAVRTEGNNNIVSLPNVTATNNQEATMKSGQKVPFVTGQYTNTGAGNGGGNGSVNPFTTVNRQDVGTTLKVTPQIIAGNDEVILKISLVSSELSGQSGDAGSLITNERSVETSVRVRSGGTIVIGGMIRNNSDNSVTRVPFLSRIPFFGELFKTRSGRRDKTNMMVFIQPKILRDAIQANAETAAKYNDLRDQVSKQKGKKELLPLLPKDSDPGLPELPPPPPAVTPSTPAPPRP